MDSTSVRGNVLVGLITATIAGGVTAYAVKSPTYIIEGDVLLSQMTDGGWSGSFAGVVSTTAMLVVDGGVADARIGVTDIGVTDIGIKADAAILARNDAAVVTSSDATTSPTASYGLYEPPSTAPLPAGQQLTVNVIPPPTALSSFTDPNFPNVSVRRLAATGYHDYSQLRALSDDNTMIMLYNAAGQHVFSQYPSMVPVYTDAANLFAAPRWMPGMGLHRIVYFAAQPARLMQYDLDTKITSTLVTVPSIPYTIAGNAWEQPSDDGQWWSLYLNPGTTGPKRIIAAVNAKTGAVGAQMSIESLYTPLGPCAVDKDWGMLEPDFIKPTPSGKYLAVQWVRSTDERCGGLELFDVATGAFIRRVHLHHGHGDFGTDMAGREFYLTSEMYSPLSNNWPTFSLEYLDGSPRQFPRLFAWDPVVGSALGHVSCQGARAGNFCTLSGAGSYRGGPLLPGLGEIYLLNILDGSMLRLAHHRSASIGKDEMAVYWAMPKASMSADGRHIVFSSNFGTADATAPYAIDLP